MGLFHGHRGHRHGHDHAHDHGHEDDHDHAHDHAGEPPARPKPRARDNSKPDAAAEAAGGIHHHGSEPGTALGWALGLNFGFLVVEVVIGLLTGSIAVLSDAGHMVADVAALAIAFAAQRLSRIRGGSAYTFGLRRLPILGGLANALTLNAIVVLIVVAGFQRLTEPPHVEGIPVLIAGIIGLAVNVGGAWILWRRGGASLNVRGALAHLLADALGSIGVIVSGTVLALTGWALIDPIVSLLIAVLIAIGTWPLVRDLVRTLLLRSPMEIDTDQVREVFLSDESVQCLEDFHLWELDTDYLVLSARLHANAGIDTLEKAEALRTRLAARLARDFKIHHVTIEVGPHVEGAPHGENDCLARA